MTRRKTFEGREVIGCDVVVSGATAGADTHDPFQVGDVVFLVCEAVVDKVSHKAVKDSDKLLRVTSAKSLIGAVVDGDLVRDAISLARIAAEARDGIQQLGLGGDGD
jgi:hypothetical protein